MFCPQNSYHLDGETHEATREELNAMHCTTVVKFRESKALGRNYSEGLKKKMMVFKLGRIMYQEAYPKFQDLPDGPVAKDSVLPMQRTWVPSLVRELDPACSNKIQQGQINIF